MTDQLLGEGSKQAVETWHPEPILFEPASAWEQVSDAFFTGFLDGMNALGLFFPFLVTALIVWVGFVLWMPAAIRRAIRILRDTAQFSRTILKDSA